jgi:ribosomal protein S18 acetylase RimI-like enzyme
MGVGKSLCIQAIARAEEEGAENLHLLVNPENKAAVNLYRSLGFEPTEIPTLEKILKEEMQATSQRRIAMRLKLHPQG